MNRPKSAFRFFTLVSFIFIAFATTSFASTVYVGSARTYTTIQAGINAATNGDTIIVDAGTYNAESWPISISGKTSIILTGSGYANTTIDSSANITNANTLNVSNGSNNFTMSGFSVIQNSTTTGNGIDIQNSSSVSISNIKIIAGGVNANAYLYLFASNNSTIDSVTIAGQANNTFAGAAGIQVANSSNVTVKNSIVYNVDADFVVATNGADCDTTFINCVAYNSKITGGLFNVGFAALSVSGTPTLTLKNSIVANCTTGIDDVGPYPVFGIPAAAIFNSSYNCYNNTVDYGTNRPINGKTGDLTATNPRFVSTTLGSEDFHTQLKAIGYGFDSPCVDAGTSSGAPTTDIEGTARPQGSAFDIGAYEDKTGYHSSTSKVANKKKATVGDIVTYTVTINNSSLKSILNTQLVDATPKGFKYVNGTTTLDNVKQADPTGTTTRTFTLGTLAANTTYTLKYKLVVGSGVDFGDYTNTATLYSTSDNTLSGTAKETVTIVANPLFYTATILGKVYNDQNKNQIQDNQEEGLPDIELGLETGLRVKTDEYGRFHIENLKPQTHIIGLDTKTLPKGSKLTTPNPVLLTAVTEAIPLKANFGVYMPGEKNK